MTNKWKEGLHDISHKPNQQYACGPAFRLPLLSPSKELKCMHMGMLDMQAIVGNRFCTEECCVR